MRADYLVVLAVLVCCLSLDSCSLANGNTAAAATGGNSDRAAQTIARYGCGSCHTIPGIAGAHGLVGPPLEGVGKRVYIAGMLSNQPSNLMRWVQDPKAINEKTAMPNLGVTAEEAADIAAYLYSLK